MLDPGDHHRVVGNPILDHLARIPKGDRDLPQIMMRTGVSALGMIRKRLDRTGDRIDGSARRVRAFVDEKALEA